MANPNILVDGISGLSPPIAALAARSEQLVQFVTVSFQGGRVGLLDRTTPRGQIWFDVLNSLQQTNAPAYVEIDPASNVITELLCPLTVRVESLTPLLAGDAIEVGLVISQARHYLRRTNSDFQTLLNILESAREQGTPVLVTGTLDEREIIDVRPGPKSLGVTVLEQPTLSPSLAPVPVTLQRAQQLFNLANTKICCSASASAPCIPFSYPDDGYWGRAHEMCRRMAADGAQPEKVWIYGQLRVATEASPQVLATSSALSAIDAGSAPTEFMASAVSIVPSSLIPETGAVDAGSAPSFPSEEMLPDET
jgi:hypothetical protein